MTDAQRIWRIWIYLFGRVGRFGEDGFPVRPYEHDEREVEEDQVDNCRGAEVKASGQPTYPLNTCSTVKKFILLL